GRACTIRTTAEHHPPLEDFAASSVESGHGEAAPAAMSYFGFTAIVMSAMIFVPLERLLAARPTQPVIRRAMFMDVRYVLVNRPLIALGLAAVIGIVTIAARGLVPARVHMALASQPIWLQVVQIFVIADLGFYLAHRAFHTIPGLWRF